VLVAVYRPVAMLVVRHRIVVVIAATALVIATVPRFNDCLSSLPTRRLP
jgi:hypothetical protein